LLRDSRLYELLLKFDVDLAAKVRAAGCECGGRLDVANYPRKPRGGPITLGDEHAQRLSFCCAVDGCRSRATPPSVRFLGPKIYNGAMVILAAAMQHGPSKKRLAQIEVLLGIGRRTLVRWRRWWTEAFRTSRFWRSLRGRFMPGLDEAALPLAVLERLGDVDDERSAVIALLRLLEPISTTPGLEASAS
jgi:hypothetical protein